MPSSTDVLLSLCSEQRIFERHTGDLTDIKRQRLGETIGPST
jgi:hypothetical protein